LCDPQREFDLVVSDRSMPRMNGMELLQRIKSEPRLADLPVIFETALSQQSEIAEGIAAGVHYYLTKPFNFRLLLAVVKAALDDRLERQRIVGSVARAAGAIQLLQEGDFRLHTPDDARSLASLLAAGTPNPDSVALGLSELLLNSIEHGNLGISYSEKSQLLIEGRLHEEIEHRLQATPWGSRRVRVSTRRADTEMSIRIQDEGDGFDPSSYLELDPARALDPNGRGIAMARMISFSRLEYQGNGNTVAATVALG
jgi:CheY-like chemotaxis protein/anti-sigma regulatory factor (Ser/Thr protein kinase)